MACEEKGLEAGVSPSGGHTLERPRQASSLEVATELPYPVLLPPPSRNECIRGAERRSSPPSRLGVRGGRTLSPLPQAGQ